MEKKNNVELTNWEINVICSSLMMRANKFMDENDIDGYEMCKKVYDSIKNQKQNG